MSAARNDVSQESVVLEVTADSDVVLDIDIAPLTVTKTTRVAPDGGVGWVVAVACFVISFLTVGYSKAFVASVLKEFASDDVADVEWMKAAPTTIPLILAPLSGLFLGRFGHRATFALGYFLCATATCLGFFSATTGVLTRMLSLLLGIGLALGSCATIDSLKKHFVVNRPTAMTINATGGVLGGFVSTYWVGSMVTSVVSFQHAWFVWSAVFVTILLLGLRVFGDPEDHFVEVTKEVPVEDTAEVAEAVVEPPVSMMVRFYRCVCKCVGLGYLADPKFALVVVICVWTTFASTISTGSVGKRATALGVEEDFGLPVCVTVGQLIAAIGYGLMNRRSPLSRKFEYAIALGVTAFFALLAYACGSYWQLAIVGIVNGIFSGMLKSLPTLVLIENHGAGNLVPTLNLLKMFEGLAKLVYPTVTVQFVDAAAVGRFNLVAAWIAALFGGIFHLVCGNVFRR